VTPPQKSLVDELIDLAQDAKQNFITYDQMIQFRQERYQEELKVHTPNTNPANLAGVAVNCVFLLEIMGRNGSISIDFLRDFALEQKLPYDWHPGNPQDILVTFGTAMSQGSCNWSPSQSSTQAPYFL